MASVRRLDLLAATILCARRQFLHTFAPALREIPVNSLTPYVARLLSPCRVVFGDKAEFFFRGRLFAVARQIYILVRVFARRMACGARPFRIAPHLFGMDWTLLEFSVLRWRLAMFSSPPAEEKKAHGRRELSGGRLLLRLIAQASVWRGHSCAAFRKLFHRAERFEYSNLRFIIFGRYGVACRLVLPQDRAPSRSGEEPTSNYAKAVSFRRRHAPFGAAPCSCPGSATHFFHTHCSRLPVAYSTSRLRLRRTPRR